MDLRNQTAFKLPTPKNGERSETSATHFPLAATAGLRPSWTQIMQAVLDYLDANYDRFLNELCDYLRIPSVSAQPDHAPDMTACGEWLLKHCREIGLEAELHPTKGNPILVARTPRTGGPKKPHYLVYGHYDVQPAEPFDLWKTPPFEPRIEGCSLFARGACDNKGQNFAHLKAVEAYLKTGTELPCDITFVIEGEEEVGSKNLVPFLKEQKAALKCDNVVISDNGIPQKNLPALTYALRGIVAVEVKLTGPSRDLHSGLFGGSVDNPAMVLSQMLASLRDKDGRVNIPGYYKDVLPLSKFERASFKRLPHDDKKYAKFLGVKALFGEKGFTAIERKSARPTVEINGLTSGYQGQGSKTIVPSWASAKLTFRLVPGQSAKKVFKTVLAHLKKICPPTVKIEFGDFHGGEPYLVSPTSPAAQAALRTLKQAFGKEPVVMREGGSIPIVVDFKKVLGADTLLLGLSLPDDGAHSPNEKFDLDLFKQGMRMGAYLWQELPKGK
jgi:acetylornithine deacetylase/succinyl-diaminopimelate desuccinylase-like protein